MCSMSVTYLLAYRRSVYGPYTPPSLARINHQGIDNGNHSST